MLAASIAAPKGRSLPNQVVQLVDEENHIARRGRLGDERADALLVLAAIRRSGKQANVIERQQSHVAQHERDAAFGNALREPLGNRCLADTSRSYQRRIILAMPKQYVDYALDLRVTTPDGLQSPATCVGREIASEALERITLWRQKVTNHDKRRG